MSNRSKPKPPRWIELGRKELGLYASGPVAGPGWSNPGYFNIVYEVSERNATASKNDPPERQYRTRVETGQACRMYGEGYDAFHTLYRIYTAHARAHAQHHKESFGSCAIKPGPHKKVIRNTNGRKKRSSV